MLQPGQVRQFPDVIYGANTAAEFSQLCRSALAERGTWARERRRSYGRAGSWTSRAGEVERILESIGLFPRRRKGNPEVQRKKTVPRQFCRGTIFSMACILISGEYQKVSVIRSTPFSRIQR